MDVVFFPAPSDFRAWLEQNGEHAKELWVGFYKKGSGKPSITWPESVDEALCFGWIDGLRKSIDDDRYKIRFTPRKPRSNWSLVNSKRVRALIAEGRMRPAGLAAFEQRVEAKTGVYSFEQRETAALDASQLERFRANQQAWNFFESQAPGYRRLAAFWVMSAKKPATRARRLATLITDSEHGRTVRPLTRPSRLTDGRDLTG